ncbi:MAG TPA: urate hydroxylase PuuD [bacterium]|nr:urate hydroxylase PuuD [bacterium]
MDTSLTEILNILFRWFHVFFGIMWIGLLYFFNFVNANFAKTLDADTKKKVVPELMPRALYFFRWAAMFTFILGLLLLYINYMAPGHEGDFNSTRGHWIMLGAAFGTIMWFNVWFIIWPNQRKIINGVKTGTAAAPEIVSRAANASKINVYLSVPLIFSMLAAGKHFLHDEWYWFVGVIVIGYFAASGFYSLAPKVKTEV